MKKRCYDAFIAMNKLDVSGESKRSYFYNEQKILITLRGGTLGNL